MKQLQQYGAACLAVVLSVAAPAAFATVDYSSLTDSVDWSDVTAALLTVGGAIILLLVGMKGIKFVVRMVKGA
jgi:hypothetical protein